MSFEIVGNQLRLDGRRIGWITKLANGKRVFISPRSRARHYMRIFEGWGIAKKVLNFLQQNDFDQIHIRLHKAVVLMSELDDWLEYGINGQYHPFEAQVFLPEKYFRCKQTTLAELMEGA